MGVWGRGVGVIVERIAAGGVGRYRTPASLYIMKKSEIQKRPVCTFELSQGVILGPPSAG
jgi:hypothetical protein